MLSRPAETLPVTWLTFSPLVQLTWLGAAVVVLTAAAPALFVHLGDNAFIAQALIVGLLAIRATQVAEKCPERSGLLIVLGVALLLRLILIAVPPLLSDDIFRYVWDGRVQAAGINPYRHVPAAEALAPLRDETIFTFINRKDYAVTIYPPAAQAFFFAVTRLGESVVVMKAALVACEGVTVLALIALLRRLRHPATRVVAYAWHPLVIWEIANNGHIDGAMTALMMLALWLYACRRVTGAGIAAAIGALFKPFAILVLPVFWRPWDWCLPLVVAATATLLYVPYLSVGVGVFGFLPAYMGEERLDSGSAFWVVNTLQALVVPSPWWGRLYMAVGALILAGLALRAGFRRERTLATAVGDITGLILAFSVLLSSDYPWYFLMAVPFVALTGSPAGWALTVGGFVLYDVLPGDPQIHFAIRDAAFNLLVFATMILAAVRARGWRGARLSGALVPP
jgi:hypothetical protein